MPVDSERSSSNTATTTWLLDGSGLFNARTRASAANYAAYLHNLRAVAVVRVDSDDDAAFYVAAAEVCKRTFAWHASKQADHPVLLPHGWHVRAAETRGITAGSHKPLLVGRLFFPRGRNDRGDGAATS